MRKFDPWLIQLRKISGVTQAQMALALGTSQTNVARIEKEVSERFDYARTGAWDRDVLTTGQRVAWLRRCGHYVTDMITLVQGLSVIDRPVEWCVAEALENVLYPLRHPITAKPFILVFGNSPGDWGLQSLVARKLCAGNPPEGEFPYLPPMDTVVIWKHLSERPDQFNLHTLYSKQKFLPRCVRKRNSSDFTQCLDLKRPADCFGEAIVFASAPLLKYFDVIQLPHPNTTAELLGLFALARDAQFCILAGGDYRASELVRATTVVSGKIDYLFIRSGVSVKDYQGGVRDVIEFTDEFSIDDEDASCQRLLEDLKTVIQGKFANLKQRALGANKVVQVIGDKWWISPFNREFVAKYDLDHTLKDHRVSVGQRAMSIAEKMMPTDLQNSIGEMQSLVSEFDSEEVGEDVSMELAFINSRIRS